MGCIGRGNFWVLSWAEIRKGYSIVALAHIAKESMATITKAELSAAIVDGVGLNHREAKDMVEAFFAEVCACLEAGEEVKISGFGSFTVRDKPSRPGRNPKTGEAAIISARRVVTFHPSNALKDAVENAKPLRMD